MRTISKGQRIAIGAMIALVFIATVFFVLKATGVVFGASAPEVNDDGTMQVEDATVVVTDRNADGVTRLNDQVPVFDPNDNESESSDMSERYTKKNPFVILELVSDKAYQNLTFLNSGDEPYDTKDFEKKANQYATPTKAGEDFCSTNAYTNNLFAGLTKPLYFQASYRYYTGSDPTDFIMKRSISMPSVKYTIEGEKGSAKFMEEYNKLDFSSYIPYDASRWTEEKMKVSHKDGYFLFVLSSEGQYTIQSSTEWNPKRTTVNAFVKKPGQYNSCWKYVETLPAGAQQIDASSDMLHDYSTANASNANKYYVPATGIDIKEESDTPTCTAYYYRFQNNNLLKHAIFRQPDGTTKDIYMKIIAMTPQELNDACKEDTDMTVDILERADMVYVNGQSDDGTDTTTHYADDKAFYFKFCDSKRTNKELADYGDKNDIEWDIASKLIKKIAENRRFPVVVNSRLYHQLQDSCEYRLYWAEQNNLKCSQSNYCTRSNILKSIIIMTKFFLDQDGVFMTQYYDLIQKVKTVPGTSNVEYIGYYPNQNLCEHTANVTNEKEKKQSYYTWSCYTFYPYTLNEEGKYSLKKVTDLETLGMMHSEWFKSMDTSKFFVGHKDFYDSNIVGITGNFSMPYYFDEYADYIYEILNNRDIQRPEIQVKGATDGKLLVELNENTKARDGEELEITFTVIDKNVGMRGATSELTVNDVNMIDKDGEVVAKLPITKVSEESGNATYTCKYPCKYFYKKASVCAQELQFSAYSTITYTSTKKTRKSGTAKENVTLTQLPMFNLE